MAVAALAVVALAVLAARGGDGARPASLQRTFVSARGGIAVRYPAGWSASTRNRTPVTDPALCVVLRARHTRVRIDEYLSAERPAEDLAVYPTGAARFRVGMLEPNEDGGKSWTFREHARVFFLSVDAPAAATHTVEAIVRSIAARPQGRCRPTAGTGS